MGLHTAETSANAQFQVETRTIHGRVQRLSSLGELRVQFLSMMPDCRPRLGMDVEKQARELVKGLRVLKVAADGAAAAAGIQAGDYIQSFNGEPVSAHLMNPFNCSTDLIRRCMSCAQSSRRGFRQAFNCAAEVRLGLCGDRFARTEQCLPWCSAHCLAMTSQSKSITLVMDRSTHGQHTR